MQYRKLGNTGLSVSEIGLGGEWLERHNEAECRAVIEACEAGGVNILDCWMSEPNVRTRIGNAIAGKRDRWIIQGHIGSTWENGQYLRTRDVARVKAAFEDLLTRFQTDYIDLGMIHYVDEVQDWKEATEGPYLDYVLDLKRRGVIRHIGLSTHNPTVARLAAESGFVEMMLFSVNPAYDLLPADTDINAIFEEDYHPELKGMDPVRAELYRLCENRGVGLTVMKGYAGGRLFDEKRSPFGVALTPVQCLHYALTRPAVASVMVGFDDADQVAQALRYEEAAQAEKDYATVLAGAPRHAYGGQCTYCGHCKPCPMNIDIAMVNKLYDLAVLQPEVPASLREHYRNMENNAAACIGCGGCESRCPFGVKVTERMAKAAELFG